MKDRFRKVHTIEIQPQLAELARSRFREFPSVVAHEGDSALVLGEICRTVDSSCLFFLDGHYSGGNTGMGKQECPIIDELKEIFDHTASPFSIIIDDARLFGTHPSYPEVLTLRKFIEERAPHMTLRIENDAIVIE
jgi:hypothetical protein